MILITPQLFSVSFSAEQLPADFKNIGDLLNIVNFNTADIAMNLKKMVTTHVPMRRTLAECRSPRYGKQLLLGERCIEASDSGKRPEYSHLFFIDEIDCFIGT
jgi:hypothetical protein